MARMQIIFDGFKDLAERIDRIDSDTLEQAVEDALEATGEYIQKQVEKAAAPYAKKGGGLKGYATGEMFKAIKKDQTVHWYGKVAEVSVGFNLYEFEGWVSIFVMYGTPRMSKDQKVYNAIKGSKTQKEIASIQEEIMLKYLDLVEGN